MRTNRRTARRLRLTLVTGLALTSTAVADPDPRLEQSRAVVAEFAHQLRTELQAAMAGGGPAAAIEVCAEVAPSVASALSRETGARVSRTSLKVRNSANLPADWQSKVLSDFDESAAAGTDAPLEYVEARPDGQFRYMKAIPTGGVCLACHGSEVAEDVQALLEEEYPHDRARGYAPGDIRGAFSVVWPAAPAGQAPSVGSR